MVERTSAVAPKHLHSRSAFTLNSKLRGHIARTGVFVIGLKVTLDSWCRLTQQDCMSRLCSVPFMQAPKLQNALNAAGQSCFSLATLKKLVWIQTPSPFFRPSSHIARLIGVT